MGIYLNPGNAGFLKVRNSIYKDKSGLISLINERIGSNKCLICVSRPRRFGKTYAAHMLCAYYDHKCDSHKLFDDLEISKTDDYEKHLNKYEVIYLDIAGFLSKMNSESIPVRDVTRRIKAAIRAELVAKYPTLTSIPDATDCMLKVVELSAEKEEDRTQFVFIIDEWDAVIRIAKNDVETQMTYLNLLREWFKNGNFTSKAVAAAYMTGILPIKKDGSQTVISDFDEYPILNPGKFAEYTGFTEKEVRELCEEYDMDFEEMKRWYDGYSFAKEKSIYNPFSVMTAIDKGEVESYWKKTSEAYPLLDFIKDHLTLANGQKSELQEDIIKLIAGEHLKVNTSLFKNDFRSLRNEDDVLTLFVHLGYLAYDSATKRVRIPNEEVRLEFHELIEDAEKNELTQLRKLIANSENLLKATMKLEGATVAAAIKQIRETNYAPTHYNNEQSLRYAVKFAYIVCVDYYLKIEELPSGKGLADVVYLPKLDSALPAMVIELKWNETAESVISQIKKNNYPAILSDYYGEIILVGINYDSNTNEHTCVIEKHKKK